MKTTACTFAAFLLLLNLLVPAIGFAQGDDDQSPLGKEMGAMNRNFKTLSRQYADPTKKASSLELVTSIQKNVENEKKLTPSKAEKAADKKKYMDTFQKDLDDLGKEVAALKDAISADKPDAVKAELDKINKMKMSSHKELGVGGGGGHRGPGGPGGFGGPGGRGPGGPGGPDGGPRPPAEPSGSPAPSASPSPAM